MRSPSSNSCERSRAEAASSERTRWRIAAREERSSAVPRRRLAILHHFLERGADPLSETLCACAIWPSFALAFKATIC